MRKALRASSVKRISAGGVVLALVALFGLPTTALAAGPTQVELNGAGTILTADANATLPVQVNVITVGNTGPVAGGGISIKDTGPSGDGVFAGPNAIAAGCTDTVTDQVRCPFGSITSIVVNAGSGNDTIIVLNDDVPTTANGGDGDDSLRGGGAADSLHGDDGEDDLVGGAGGDVLDGGANTGVGEQDIVDYGSSTDAVSVNLNGLADDGLIDADPGTLGNQSEGDNVSGAEIVEGSAHADILTGGALNDTLVGNAGNDDLNGGVGDDTLRGGTGADDYDGGGPGDFDTVSYGTTSQDVFVDLDNVNDDGPAGEQDNVRDSVERVIGGIGSDELTGAAGAQTLNGGGGNDVINGDVGDDVLQGGTGSDTVSYDGRAGSVDVTLNGLADDGEGAEADNVANDIENILGGDGDDNLTGNDGRNRIDGGLGGDTMNGDGGNDTLVGSVGLNDAGDILIGGAGTDVAAYGDASAGADVTLDNVANDNGQGDNVRSSVENVNGSNFVDTIVGSAARNTINGGCGDDILSGDPALATSNDTLNGGPGDDTLHGNLGADSLNGGSGPGSSVACGVFTDADNIDGGGGSDLVSYSTRTAPVTVTLGAGVNDDGEAGEGDNVQADVERITGGRAGDTLIGNTGLDRINGGNGGDTINGGAGGDILSGGNGDDDITGGSGKDTMSGSAGDDTFHAVDGVKDSITCGDGNDTVFKDAIDSTSANCVP
jgi:Ca2+-binding RTX toxin-like protein